MYFDKGLSHGTVNHRVRTERVNVLVPSLKLSNNVGFDAKSLHAHKNIKSVTVSHYIYMF